MNRVEYILRSSEISELEAILKEIPEQNVIERLSFESRLQEVRESIEGIILPASQRLKLIFQGQPVIDTYYAIDAGFAGQALDKFTNAVAALIASLEGTPLNAEGPVPEKQQSQLLIVGPAVGSFGFELELPASGENVPLGERFEEKHVAGESVKKILRIFQVAAEGTDEELSKLIDEVQLNAVAKIHEFLEFQLQHKAWCGLEFDGNFFRFRDLEQLAASVSRLALREIRGEKDSPHYILDSLENAVPL